VPLDTVRRPKATPIHELERYMRCKDCSQDRGASAVLNALPIQPLAAETRQATDDHDKILMKHS